MANPKRLMILCCLVLVVRGGGRGGGLFGLSLSALSHHLSKRRAQLLVKTRRDAQTIYYSCTSPAVLKVLSSLEDIYCAPIRTTGVAA